MDGQHEHGQAPEDRGRGTEDRIALRNPRLRSPVPGLPRETGLGGLYFYNARWYEPGVGRFLQADTLVPDGDKASIVPLTVGFHEPRFLAQLNAEDRYTLTHGFWPQLSTREKRESKAPHGPLNPQALNRYSYAGNNPINFTDPMGHNPIAAVLVAALPAIAIGATIVAAIFYYDVFLSPNATENRARFENGVDAWASSIESTARQVSSDINVVFSKGEYIPRGFTKEQRDTYRDAVHIYKRARGLAPDYDVPINILDQIGEAIKGGDNARDAADQADDPPD